MIPALALSVLLGASAASAATTTSTANKQPWYLQEASSAVVQFAIDHRSADVPEATASEIGHYLADGALEQPVATELGSLLVKFWAESGPNVQPTEVLEYAQVAASGYSSLKNNKEYPKYVSYARAQATKFDLSVPTPTGNSTLIEEHKKHIASVYSSLEADPVGKEAISTLSSVYDGYYKDFAGTGANSLLHHLEMAVGKLIFQAV